MTKKPVVLCILDGWGHAPASKTNAITEANLPTWNQLCAQGPVRTLEASGPAVGLPEGQMGNSEVGHLTLGSGQILLQDLPRITQAVETNSLQKNKELLVLIETLKRSSGTCHLMGLLSNGGIHSHLSHIKALIKILATNHIPVCIHGFLDGRDTPPTSAPLFLKELLSFCASWPNVKIATLSGRYYAMDRDENWERIQPVYEAITQGKGPVYTDAVSCIENQHAHGITDEFISPHVAEGYQGIHANDAFLMANFRADRARQLLKALTFPEFQDFVRDTPVHACSFYGLTQYADWLAPYMHTLFPPQSPETTLGEILEKNGLTQFRIAETEKYAHVTYFFNGGNETPSPHETRVLIPSPKVATYDLKPEMNAEEVTSQLCDAIDSRKYDFLLVNYANPDMVGHTGNKHAAIQAVEAIDRCLARLLSCTLKNEGILLITADHGNVECMENPTTHKPHTAHTCFPVPFVLAGKKGGSFHQDPAGLVDVAPTVLDLLNIPSPTYFSGHSLIKKD